MIWIKQKQNYLKNRKISEIRTGLTTEDSTAERETQDLSVIYLFKKKRKNKLIK